MTADGPEQRQAELDERLARDAERAELLASDDWDARLSEQSSDLQTSIATLGKSILMMRMERDRLYAALHDLEFGARVMLDVPGLLDSWPPSARQYVEEVRRVAGAAKQS